MRPHERDGQENGTAKNQPRGKVVRLFDIMVKQQ